jgi:hypothetical protein
VMTGERLMTDGLTIPLPAVPYAGLVRYAIADAAGGGTASVPVNQQQ